MSDWGGHRCCMVNCSSSDNPKRGVKETLFRFPKDAKRSTLWIKACGRNDLLSKKPIQLYNNYRVCRRHFERKMFLNYEKTRLQPNAVPSGIINDNNKETDPSLFDVTMHSVNIQNLKQNEVDLLVCNNNNEVNEMDIKDKITSTRINTLHAEQREIKAVSDATIQTGLSLSSLSPRKVKLHQRIKKYKKKIAQMEAKMQEIQDSKVQDFDALDMLLDKFYPKETASFLKTQARLFHKESKGRRYSATFKQHCLAIYFASPKTYRNLAKKSKIFCLPSCSTLNKFTQHCYIDPGLQNDAFEMLKNKVRVLKGINTYCMICMDEMSLKTYLFYNITRDKVIGYEDTGNSQSCRSLLPARNVAVLMVRGICQRWKQPLAYFFVHITMKASDVLLIVTEAVRKLKTIGLKVIGLTTDMGSNFYKLSHLLNVTPEKPYFNIDDNKIYYIFDTPHLLKATRNNLLRHNYIYEDKIALWKYIRQFYYCDKNAQFRTAPKLTDTHIKPNNFQRMKVKCAAQVFSRSVSAGMNTYITLGSLPTAAMFTVEFIERFNKLFDILNSSKVYSKDSNKQAFTSTNEQTSFLIEMVDFLQCIRVVNKDGKNVTNSIKSLQCWVITINSVLQLWKDLQQSSISFKYLLTRRLNQDALENFFGGIRNQNGNCFNPTPIQFFNGLKKFFSVEYIKANTGNCETDEDTVLAQYQEFNNSENVVFSTTAQKETNVDVDNHNYRDMPVTEENVFIYLCGYLLRSIFKKHYCDTCAMLAQNDSTLETCYMYSYFKAYDNNESTYGNLYIPSVIFINYIKELHFKFVENFNFITEKNVMQQFLKILCLIELPNSCPDFPKMYLLRLFIRVRIYYELKFMNRDLKKNKEGNRKSIILCHA